MIFKKNFVLIFLVVLAKQSESALTAYEANPTTLITDELPINPNTNNIEPKLMPYVGNGHIASTIFNNAIFMNGLYNGQRGESHRARLPNVHNFSFISPAGNFTRQQYVLDLKNGVFIEQLEDDLVTIERKIFAHQYYNRLMITHVTATRKSKSSLKKKITIKLDNLKNYTSDDIDFKPIVSKDNYKILRGKTKFIEFDQFQKKLRSVFMYFNEPTDLVIKSGKKRVTRVFVSSIDVKEEPARKEFKLAMSRIKKGKASSLYEDHASKFANLWEMGRIETDNEEIQTVIYSSYYYLLSSLPAPVHHGKLNQFYGLSPGSLSRGSYLQDYQGHSFWDTEIWMFPSILMFYPDTAKEVLSYRISIHDAYLTNAEIFNTSGWRFPWESAYTGLDVTPDCCPEVKLYQIHINGDVAFAARQYFSATRNEKWLKKEGGFDLITNIAEFWSSRMTYNSTKQQFELLGVLPPDEDAQPNVNNSVYTNIIASLSIHYANYATCVADEETPIDPSWVHKARCLHLPFDETRNFHPEYEGYVDKEIKQADVVLIGFPLMWPMDPEVRRNDLLFYENKTRINGPAMTWGMHAIGFIELGDYDKAAELLNRSYSRYVKQPFNTWTEAYQDVGAVNFITGAGGFLQTLLFGYGGLRLHAEELRFNGNLPLVPDSTYLYLHRIKYLGASLSFNFTADIITLIVDSIGPEHNLELTTPDKILNLKNRHTINLPKIDFDYKIKASDPTDCPLPMDAIDLSKCSDVA